MPKIAPFGTWPSPITSALLTKAAAGISEVMVDPVRSGDVWWVENRPEESGRSVLVHRTPDGTTDEPSPADFSARTRVHEYGGGGWSVYDGVGYASNFTDQRLYRIAGGEATPVSPKPVEPAGLRYADGRVTADGRWWVGVQEHHHGDAEPVNEVVRFDLRGDLPTEPEVLVSGPDFVMFPRVSPDGTQLAWTSWNHPDMPWDRGMTLWAAPIDADGLGEAVAIASEGESIFQPEWADDGSLYFVSDRDDWWTLYRYSQGAASKVIEREWEVATPQWVFGLARYALLADGRVVCAASNQGTDWLYVVNNGEATIIDVPFTAISSVRGYGAGIVCVAASPTLEPSVRHVGLSAARPPAEVDHPAEAPGGAHPPALVETLRPPRDLDLPAGVISEPQPISFPTTGGDTAHALYYPPAHNEFEGPEGTLPPLVVAIHGGPTSAARPQLQLGHQYWTSRGFAVVDVNYRGSVGFGRPYRHKLNERWGIADVDDCVSAARYLADSGMVDGDRMVIRGGSAGGFTTLAALAFHDVFAAGASHYGIADLEVLATDTHKFESRYLDHLVGPYPEAAETYRERSPIHSIDRLDRPLAIFQGADDKVVPPNQAEMVAKALDEKGVPHILRIYAGEGHGFRQAATIQEVIDTEYAFYCDVLSLSA